MPNPGFPRARRLAGTIKRLVTEWLEHQPADRRLGFVTITDVRVSGDLRHAKVYFTVLDPGVGGGRAAGDGRAETIQTLTEATPEARTWVAQRVRLRYAPTLQFLEDDVALRGAHIDRLLAELDTPGTDPPAPAERPPG
jgi:ribosome-binding factor A